MFFEKLEDKLDNQDNMKTQGFSIQDNRNHIPKRFKYSLIKVLVNHHTYIFNFPEISVLLSFIKRIAVKLNNRRIIKSLK